MKTSTNPHHVNIFKVASKTTKGKEYVVREMIWEDESGNIVEWKCSCPQSILKNKICKHIREIQNAR